jgi:hypothetical protein
MGGCCAEGCIADIRDVRMEKKSGKWGRMEATFEGGHDLVGAVVPRTDGWNHILTPAANQTGSTFHTRYPPAV